MAQRVSGYAHMVLHLAAAIALGVFVYGPDDVRSGTFETLTLAIFFPLLGLTGAISLVRRLRSG